MTVERRGNGRRSNARTPGQRLPILVLLAYLWAATLIWRSVDAQLGEHDGDRALRYLCVGLAVVAVAALYQLRRRKVMKRCETGA